MTTMYDSVTGLAIPFNAQIVAGYIDGAYGPNDPFGSGWSAAAWAHYPNAYHVTITIAGTAGARVADCESGAMSPQQGANWALNEIRNGRRPTIYASEWDWLNVIDPAIGAVGLHRGSEVDGWMAWTGHTIIPAGFVAIQFAQNVPGNGGSGVDISYTNGIWPQNSAPNPPPPAPAQTETDMIARDDVTGGVWIVRPNGNVYAKFGAPYLGPLPKYLAQWGNVGSAAYPITGIVSDAAGGFILSADSGGAEPGAFHIPLAGGPNGPPYAT